MLAEVLFQDFLYKERHMRVFNTILRSDFELYGGLSKKCMDKPKKNILFFVQFKVKEIQTKFV